VALDERLHRELERAARPADPSGVYEHLLRRHERRRILRHVQAFGLALVVVAGTVVGFLALTRVFGASEVGQPGDPTSANGRIAYVTHEEATDEPGFVSVVSTVAPDGSDPTRLVEVPGMITGLDWSPDGTRLAIATHIDIRNSVFIVEADGSGLRRVTRSAANTDVSWSPDGTLLAYLDEWNQTVALFVTDLAGEQQQRLTGADLYVATPDWSPDGTSIALASEEPNVEPEFWDIYVVDVETLAVRRLTDDPALDLEPQWSPDGSKILFRSRRDDVPSEPAGSDSPDEIYVMNADGSGQTRLTFDAAIDQWPVWSPDGTLIAYTSQGPDDTSGIVIMKADGSDPRSLSVDGFALAWQPIPADVGDVSQTPSPEPTESPSPTAGVGNDIGLGFAVCDVTSVSGEFAPGKRGTAYVATEMSDVGRCPEIGFGGAFQVVAVDVTGDGMADASFGPVECDPFCSAFAAPDVDGDGTDELLIENIQFSIAGLRLYEVRADPPGVFPVTVSTPGYPQGGLPPGAEPQLWIGGDGFQLDTLRCVTDPGSRFARILIQTSASQVPPDDPDAVWQATATWFALDQDGTVSIVDTGTFEEPVTSEPPSFAQEGSVCGAHLPPPYGGG
jgi:Tol biopolymer transport system component